MENLIKNKISLLIVLTILLIITAGVFFYLYPVGKNNMETKQSDAVVTEQVKGSKTLVGFPENLPIDSGSVIVQNYESTANDGRVQSTKHFTTKLGTDEAISKYVEFYKNDGWRVVGKEVSPVSLTRQGDILRLEVTPFKEPKTNLVKLTLVQNKK